MPHACCIPRRTLYIPKAEARHAMIYRTLRRLPRLGAVWLALIYCYAASAAGSGALTEQLRVRIEIGQQQGQRIAAGEHTLAERS